MTNVFMKVNKDFFKLGLNPTEILILAQVMEFNTNTGNCFITDKQLAEQFGVSDKTISRSMKVLEDKGFIRRETKNVKGGKERHIFINLSNIELALSKDKMSVVNNDLSNSQQTKCPLTTDKMSIDKGQNVLIKDNIKDKEKDNIGEIEKPSALSISLSNNPEEKKPVEEKKLPEYLKVSKEKLDAMGARYELVVGNLGYIIDTGVRIELI